MRPAERFPGIDFVNKRSNIYICAPFCMETDPRITFDDTAIAFSYKSDRELRKANFIFSLVNHPTMSALATGAAKLGLKLHLPIEGMIKSTAFDHFCGGTSIEDSEQVIQKIGGYGVGTILDYAVEGEDSDEAFDKTAAEVIRTIDKAKASTHIPFSVFKPTGVASFALLEKVQRDEKLSDDEAAAYGRVRDRFKRICQHGYASGVPVLIDAEDWCIQNTIDEIATEMMATFNKERVIVFNTYQMYRTESLTNLHGAFERAKENNYHVGAKLVRGAYMEKERDRAARMGYPSPIHANKEATDKAFNDALAFCIEQLDRMAVMCGSHNEYSNAFLVGLMAQKGIANDDKRVWFAQLYGMSDNISFNLARKGYCVAKYVPYGPVRAVMPYLLRRAEENTSVAGQSSRELTLIRRELSRRRNTR